MTTVETADPLAGIADREQVFTGGVGGLDAGDEWIDVVDSWSERTAARAVRDGRRCRAGGRGGAGVVQQG